MGAPPSSIPVAFLLVVVVLLAAQPVLARSRRTTIAFQASLRPRPIVLNVIPPVLRVSSENVTGSGLLTTTSRSNKVHLKLTVGGTYPSEAGVPSQPFNPGTNVAITVTLFVKDESKRFAPGPRLNGTWSAIGAAFQFTGTTRLPGNKLVATRGRAYALVLEIPPYPRLSDFVYVSWGGLRRV